MTGFRFAFVLVAIGTLAAGCPSSTTLVLDSGVPPGVDAGGSPPSWADCTATSQCELRAAGCCQTCGTPTLADVDAVNRDHETEHFDAVCPAPTPCPRCATGNNPSLVASCQMQHCVDLDLSMLPLSECTADSDCVVRYANCCSCSGTPDEVVSVRTDAEGAVVQLLCDGGGCPTDCVPHADPGFRAVCDPTTRHCAAVPIGIGP